MFGSLGFPELMLIFLVALVVFGPRKLPDIGRSIGKALGEFKRATNDLKSSLEEEVRIEDQKLMISPPATPPTPTTPLGSVDPNN